MNRRYFIKLGTAGALISVADLTSCATPDNEKTDADIVVAGGTPAGIMAAIGAARAGSKVVLIEYHRHIGGLSTSGLGKSDIENKNAIAGLFREFTQNILRYYTEKYGAGSENVTKCREGYYYEPSVAEHVFNAMVAAEPDITLLKGYQIEKVLTRSGKAREAAFRNWETGQLITLKAKAFIDATYEGDLYALAGAAYRLGREGKADFNEPHAGQIFFDYNENEFLEGSTGEGDHRIPAYTYRLCLTDDPANSYVMKEAPSGYDRKNYLGYFRDLEEGRLGGPKVFKEGHGYYKAHFDTMVRVFSFAEIPNRKYDVNTNPRPLGFPFPEENFNYVEASWEEREKVFQRHRELALGLLYFIQNDPEVPEAHRKLANQYHLPLDEFTDNEHFPWQLYVREARRLKGAYTLTENDLALRNGEGRTTVFPDTIIAGEFPIDSFPCSREPSADNKVLEGYIGMLPIPAYQLPYRVLVPESIDGVIVPVAASTTHVAYSTLRMEPLWMGIGQAAGLAASLSVRNNTPIREVKMADLQRQLVESGQILTYFDDLDPDDKAHKAAQFWGTKGFFGSYKAELRRAVTGAELNRWIALFTETAESAKTAPAVAEIEKVTREEFGKVLEQLGIPTANHDAGYYDHTAGGQEVLRGEVCMTLFAALSPDSNL
ncbi:MAG: hypothetical protein ABS46_18820 [Cytophagaceae bacterium SCN 52-12]|nr:MAG: hypothetical protein ABS46_18820 [Cytophagaceae bacterium SCN 52-12]